MCGIAGIYNFRSGRPAAPSELRTMGTCLAHRGPDDEGYYEEGSLGLAHKRLSIVDTSRRGHQPMFTDDGQLALIFNGEVYNFVELRAELEAQGHTFQSHSDSEVILRLYQVEGEDMLAKLNGMFAFAIWDRRAKSLFIARDRLGIKPLYYTVTPDGIVFASEIKAILAVSHERPKVNLEMLDAYMSVGYVPTERTLFQGIEKLQPGWCMKVDRDGLHLRQYWDLRPETEEMSEDECIRRSLGLLRDSVRLQLRSDVPLGVFLSGGVDSSAVVALMHEMGIQDIRTFTVAYDFGPEFDETRYARMVAEKFNTVHREVFVTPEEFRDFIPSLVWHMDEPVTESAAISLFFVSKLAREDVVVVLSGEGSDEVFGGYPIYKYMQALERYRMLPEPLRQKMINPVLNRLGGKWNKYTELSDQPLAKRYTGVSFYETPVKNALYRPEIRNLFNGSAMPGLVGRYYEPTEGLDPLLRMMYLDVKSWLPDDLLIKADKMTMATSVELRVPFLDHRVVELGGRIPPRLRVKGWETKYVLKKAMEPYLPKEILYRGKMGFPTPLARMFKGDLKGYVEQVLGSDRFLDRGYFQPEAVRRMVSEHAAGERDHHRVLWQLLVLEEWHRRFIDGEAAPAALAGGPRPAAYAG
ncbi:MAG TPA: asparagine synthase (glutamine-hydrolyzing) [Thermoanaerobaculia bacterium]|jgi:asparagine synthase (glutamine-hydrolysing)|nr:asparagine synthase (glutamine-hydrolyzing) [Thermoanaerobaculia bacterium]